MYCTDELSISIFQNLKYYFFAVDVPVLVYYSHLTAIIVSLIFTVFIYKHNRDAVTKLLVAISGVFALIAAIDILLWTQINSSILMFLWSNLLVLSIVLFILSCYFIYTFVTKKTPPIVVNNVVLLSVLGAIFVSSSSYHLEIFDLANCNALEHIFSVTGLIIFALSAQIFILVFSAWFLRRYILDKETQKQTWLVVGGMTGFLFSFSFATYVASVANIFESEPDIFILEQYGFFGMSLFISFMVYAVVKYKAFNIKLLGAQALVWSLAILVGSQFFFIRNDTNRVLNMITLVFVSVSGSVLVRSVKSIDTQRELLEKSNAEQEVLMHFITHQIKGFFTKSRNILDTISDEAEALSPSINRLVQEGLRSDKEGIDLVQNILNAANLKNGKITYVDNFFDMDALVKNVIKELEPSAKTKDLTINYYCTTSPIQVRADEARMKDLVRNLIQNAILYTFKGGANISLMQHDTNIEFTVKDTGIGLTESDKSRLFQSGGRGEESVKYNTGSTGYGLFIAKKVVDNYKGFIWAESEGRDKGSKFVAVLPIAQPLVK